MREGSVYLRLTERRHQALYYDIDRHPFLGPLVAAQAGGILLGDAKEFVDLVSGQMDIIRGLARAREVTRLQ